MNGKEEERRLSFLSGINRIYAVQNYPFLGEGGSAIALTDEEKPPVYGPLFPE